MRKTRGGPAAGAGESQSAMMDSPFQRLEEETRLYGRSKGLVLVAQGIVFMLGVLPLLYILRVSPSLERAVAGGLNAASAAWFLFAVWLGLKLVPSIIERAYYGQVGDVQASAPVTPDWCRFLAPFCLLTPICLAGLGILDAWQAAVLALVAFGLYMYLGGRFVTREPATEVIGAVTILMGGALAALPGLVPPAIAGPGPAWLKDVLSAQTAALATVAGLGLAWTPAAIILHFYNKSILSRLSRAAREHLIDQGGSPDGE